MEKDNKTITTSLKVDKQLWKQAKKRAIDEGITLQDLLNNALEERLKKKGEKEI
jgi:predicted DNA binding CopG/RHH family protein